MTPLNPLSTTDPAGTATVASAPSESTTPSESTAASNSTAKERHRTETLIVGAGPAGIAAAITLHRAGRDVVVIDKATFPRDKCCGDGLTTGALRMLDELGLDPASVPSWKQVQRVQIAGPKGKSVAFDLPEEAGAFAAIARRSELDHALVNHALSLGIRIHQDTPLLEISAGPESINAHTPPAVFEAQHLIAADGMWSPTRKLLGLSVEGYRGEWHAFRQYYTNVSPAAQNELFVWFEEDLLPGYVWAFPLGDGSANVGFGIQRGRGMDIQAMNTVWKELLDRPRIREVLGPDATPEARHQAWPIPARLGRLRLTHGRVLFVGDAAAATDPMTGEGIGQAIETGMQAGEAILAGTDFTAIAAEYEQRLHHGMEKDHALAERLSNLLARPRLAQASVRIASATAWSRRNFVRWLFEDYPRAILATPRRWHRGLFSQPGAYRQHLGTE